MQNPTKKDNLPQSPQNSSQKSYFASSKRIAEIDENNILDTKRKSKKTKRFISEEEEDDLEKSSNKTDVSSASNTNSVDWKDHVFEGHFPSNHDESESAHVNSMQEFGGPRSAFVKFTKQSKEPNSNANPRLLENQSNNAFALVDYSFSKKGNSKD
jgi:hypothetical protein